MKYAVVIMDGGADIPSDLLGGLTPFEAANTPTLDYMASHGLVGVSRNTPEGMIASSNIACTSILGYDPAEYPIGRGAIEGAACGVELEAGQVAFRVNLVNIQDGIMNSYSSDNISSEDGHKICEELAAALDDETFKLYPGTGFRETLVVSGHPELLNVTCHAAHDISDENIAGYMPTGTGANILLDWMERADRVLASSQVNAQRNTEGKMVANAVWAFWPGEKPGSMKSFSQVRGLTAGMTSGVDLLNGLAKLSGMKEYYFDGVNDTPSTDYKSQGAGALGMLEDNDVVFVHVEAPDTAGHDGDIVTKAWTIEQIDAHILAPLMEYAKSNDLRILALPDHPTPASTKRHSQDNVPFALWGPGISRNGAEAYSEIEAQSTGLFVDPGYKLMDMLTQKFTLGRASEDYLEAMVVLEQRSEQSIIRSVDIAEEVGVSKASVNKAVTLLKQFGCVEQSHYGKVRLTELGRQYGEAIFARHKTLRKFLIECLGVDPLIANEEACLMEHTVSANTMEKWTKFIEECEK